MVDVKAQGGKKGQGERMREREGMKAEGRTQQCMHHCFSLEETQLEANKYS